MSITKTRSWKPFTFEPLDGLPETVQFPRTSHFGICWIKAGAGHACLDAARFPVSAHQLLFTTPYQYFRLECEEPFQLERLLFHANFLCVETFHAETGCSGPLFNDPYHLPVVSLNRAAQAETSWFFKRLHDESRHQALGVQEALLAYTRLLLIHAARWKGVTETQSPADRQFRHPVLAPLKELIESNYRAWHTPAEYAAALHMTAKSLGRCVREELGKTLTELIRQRILTHAKWELLHTLKPVKQVAAELGFRDELYFSRLFKKNIGLSPTAFRQYETEIRGGSNLSISSSATSIPDSHQTPDNRK